VMLVKMRVIGKKEVGSLVWYSGRGPLAGWICPRLDRFLRPVTSPC